MKLNHNYSSRFRILKGGKISLVVSALLASTSLSLAAPSGGVVTSGSATINQSGKVTNINQSTSKASINWNKFGIKANEVVNFIQPDKNSITLNRVIGNERSIIDGALNANGQVWILNSNGVLFGKNASINTAGLLATTKDISDTDFQSGNYTFSGDSTESVINQGTIKIKDNGYVILDSNEVRNSGTIEAIKGRVQLTGADEYTLNLNGNSLVDLVVDKGVLDALVENSGTILADGGEVYLTTNAVDELLRGVVNNTGIIEANSLDGISGHVELFAHGGEIQVGGEIRAKDGFVETSGKFFSFNDARIEAGEWLIDPVDVTIDATLANAIQSQLASGDMTIETVGAGADDGDITVNSDITWSSTNRLTLNADNEIYVNATIENTNNTNGGVYFNAVNKNAAIKFDETTGKVIINNINQLQWITQALNGNYELGSNIDASITSTWNSDGSGGYYGFKQIGDNSTNNLNTRFTGTFDGKGFVIDGLYINRPSENDIGLFGRTYAYGSNRANISNLALINVDIKGNIRVGGLIGFNTNSTVTNSYITGNINGDNNVGGLVGLNDFSTITNSYSTANITGNIRVGGLVGLNQQNAQVINSYTTEGSLIGVNWATITNSYSTTSFNESTYTGFDFSNDWIIYEGYTRPLLRTFMTELTVSANDYTRTYDGTTYSVGSSGVTYSNPTYDSSLVYGTLNYTSSGDLKNAGTATIGIDGLYSSQQGYIINYTDGTLTTNKKSLTANYVTSDKVYDGTTDATVIGTIHGVISGDTVSHSITSANFSDKNVGNGKTVTISGITLSGVDSANYSISDTTTTASITPKTISATFTADDKVYDGTTDATVKGVFDGVISGDDISVSQSASFSDKDAGENKTVNITNITLAGTDIANYTFDNSDTTSTASITPKTLTANFTVSDKVYDGTTTANASLDGDLSGIISGDSVFLDSFSASFSDKNVGNKAISISNISLTGTGSSNYTITSSSSSTASITPKTISATFTAEDKVYDGTIDATVNGVFDGIISGDDVSLSQSASFLNKNVEDEKTVNITNISLSGSGSSNYTISSSSSSTASITPKKLSATFNGNDKVYDGTTSANVEAVLEGLISGDDITVSQSALFEDKNAGENKTINITDISLSGDDMKNYSIVTDDSTSTTATINKVLATVTVDNKEVVYNGETHTIDSFSVNGLVNNEDKSVIDSITLQGEGKDAGTHIISALGEDNNYNLEFIDGELKITPKLINVTYSANNKEYDGSTFAIANGSLSGVIQGDDIKAIYSSANFEDEKPANDKNVYIEGISLTGSDSRNYILDKNSYITTASINNSLDSLIASIINDSTINSVEDFNDIDFNSLDINPEKITNIENIITDLLQQGEISFPIINGIVLRVLDGGINMPYGTQRQLILEEDENEKEDEI